MKSAGKARSNGLYRHIRTSKEIIRNLLNDYKKNINCPANTICSASAGLFPSQSPILLSGSHLLAHNETKVQTQTHSPYIPDSDHRYRPDHPDLPRHNLHGTHPVSPA